MYQKLMINMLKNFQKIAVEAPVDNIIRQIRRLITSGQLKPGDKLPSERKLAKQLGVGRTHIRDAIAKLEFYGILKTMPQSGTIVAGIGITALEGLITDVLKLENSDFSDLIETRVLLEIQATRMAAKRRTVDDIINMKSALTAYQKKIKEGVPGVEEDLLFHLKIAEAGGNSVLKSLMMIITPDIVKSFTKLEVCKDGRFYQSLEEHEVILEHIVNQEPELAAKAMEEHLQDVIEYSQLLKKKSMFQKIIGNNMS